MLDGKNFFQKFDANLASYAQKNSESRGRTFSESADPNRLPFQRDRDRIIHCTSFRRLKGKMQVLPPEFGDHFRNRLSHSLEVAQIARDLARQLFLNEDLVEAIALGHDLGHPPFGHSGESALDKKMKEFGSHFDHNEQSLRVVTFFERRYTSFNGLNLSLEVLEGLQKHETFFDRSFDEKIFSPNLETQLVDISDEIAYLSADLEDGLRGRFFQISDLEKIEIPATAIMSLPENEKNFRSAIVRRIIRDLLIQLATDTEKNIKKYSIKTLQDVQNSKAKIIYLNADFFVKFKALKDFLFQHFYMNSCVKEMTNRGRLIIEETFDFLLKNEAFMPMEFLPEENLHRRICDYIAGMTDHFLLDFWEKNVNI